MWNQLSNSLLENNHIKIPIQKRFFLAFIEDDETNVNKDKILNELLKHGFLEDDPRLKDLRNKFKYIVKTQTINYEEFSHCIENHISLLQKIFQRKLIIPKFNEFSDTIESIYTSTLSCNGGTQADYIPQLARVDPEQYGVSICTIDGQRYNKGDTNVDFTVQSCCKPINYGIALEELTED